MNNRFPNSSDRYNKIVKQWEESENQRTKDLLQRSIERGIIPPWIKNTTTPTESNSQPNDGSTTESTPPTT